MKKHQSIGGFRAAGSWLLVFCILASVTFVQPGVAEAAAFQDDLWQNTLAQAALDESCVDMDAGDLRAELNSVAQRAFGGDEGAVDIGAIVAEQWALLGVDSIIDAEVDRAVDQVRNDEDIWNQFLSGWSAAKAEELTHRVASLAFNSPNFRSTIDSLSAGVAAELAAAIAALSAQSASQATLCLQHYIRSNYSDSVAAAFSRQIESETDALFAMPDPELDSGILTVLERHQAALGGVGVIIASQIAKRVVQKIGQIIARRIGGRIVGRVVGKAGSSVIPAVGWVVGIGLFAYDIYSSREGALPEIREGLKAAEVKNEVRNEISAAVEAELALEAPQIARDVADELYELWTDFLRKYQQMLELARQEPLFAGLLTQATDLSKLASLVDAVVAVLGDDDLAQALADGTFARATEAPEAALEILRAQKSLQSMVAWVDLAGPRIEDVVRLEVYKHKNASDFQREQLNQLLDVNDAAAVAKLSLLDAADLTQLFTLASDHLKSLATKLEAEDLAWLASYLAEMEGEQRNQLVAYVERQPDVMATLRDEGLRSQIAASPDVGAALAFLSRPTDALPQDLLALVQGDVGLALFARKYGSGWVPWILLGLLVLAVILVYGVVRRVVGGVIGLLRWSLAGPSGPTSR